MNLSAVTGFAAPRCFVPVGGCAQPLVCKASATGKRLGVQGGAWHLPRERQDVPVRGTHGERKAVAVQKISALGLEFGGKVSASMPAEHGRLRGSVPVGRDPLALPKTLCPEDAAPCLDPGPSPRTRGSVLVLQAGTSHPNALPSFPLHPALSRKHKRRRSVTLPTPRQLFCPYCLPQAAPEPST